MENFGFLLKELRSERGLTQKAVASELSITVSTLSHWECGYQEPSFKDFIRICDFFDVDADFLLGRSNESVNSLLQTELEEKLTPEENKLLFSFRSLSQKKRTHILEYVQTLKKI